MVIMGTVGDVCGRIEDDEREDGEQVMSDGKDWPKGDCNCVYLDGQT